MRIETKSYVVLVPEAGLWLYNEKDGIVSNKVYLGKEASSLDWVEITEQQKQEIEAQREAQENAKKHLVKTIDKLE